MTARVSFGERARAVAAAVGWILLFAAAGLTATVLLGWSVGWATGMEWRWDGPSGSWAMVSGGAVTVAGLGLATWLVGHRWNGKSWTSLGWGAPRRWGARLAVGVGLGGVMAALAVTLAVVASGARVGPDGAGEPAGHVVPLALGLLLAALAEELLFRGYPLRRLADAVGRRAAALVLAAAFGAAHLGNPNATALGALNTGLAAVWLATAFFSAGGMPLAWGLHFGWNAGLGLGFDAPVSGFTFDLPHLDYAPGRAAWLDGGAFGPEGGVAATLVFAAGTLVLARWPGPAPEEELA